MATSGYDPARIVKEEKIVKILGRPIRLADVLLAMDLQGRYEKEVKNTDKEFAQRCWDNTGKALMRFLKGWNLKDDNLDNQSDETKQFLIDLLTPSQSSK